jgi:hypothetical protein
MNNDEFMCMFSRECPPETELLYDYFKKHAKDKAVSISYTTLKEIFPMRWRRMINGLLFLEKGKYIKIDRREFKKSRKCFTYKFVEKERK